MLPEMEFAADREQFDYLTRTTGYKAACSAHREAIEAGVALYNHAITRTEEDGAEDGALLAERAKAEAALAGKHRDYGAMRAVVQAWDTLLPAIHDYYDTRRLVRGLLPALDVAAGKELVTEMGLVEVPKGSNEGAFRTGTARMEALRAEYEDRLTDRGRLQLARRHDTVPTAG